MDNVRHLPLTNGCFALVDADDWERVSQFKWNGKSKSSQQGKVYAQRTIRLTPGRGGKQTTVALHRFIMNAGPGDVVDHINGLTLDNRKANLRITDARGNSTNVTSSKRQKIGGYKGVSWNKSAGKWEANIAGGDARENGKRRKLYLGLFNDPVAAAKAYDAAARHYFGEYASCNFTPEPIEFVPAPAANASEKEIA